MDTDTTETGQNVTDDQQADADTEWTETLLPVGRAAKELGKSERTVRRWCQQGRLPGAVTVGGEWHVPEAAIRSAAMTGQRPPADDQARPSATALATASHLADVAALVGRVENALRELGDEKAARSAAEAERDQLRERLEEERERRLEAEERRRLAETDARGARDTLTNLRRRGMWSRLFNREG